MFPLRRIFNWLRRFRHRCGYGIHSPFAFNFVTGVVFEAGEYYAYAQLESHIPANSATALRRKDLRLLFRLANCQRPAEALLLNVAADSPLFPWLRAGSRHTQWHIFGEAMPPEVNMVVADGNWPSVTGLLTDRLAEGGMLVVVNLWKSREHSAAWKRILAHPKSTVAFDLRDFGIVFYRPDLNRQHYKICYF